MVAPVLAQIAKEYPNRVRLVFRQYPLLGLHDKAMLAAEAAEAAGAQGRFWEMHDLLFGRFDEWTGLAPDVFRMRLESYAADIGLDVERFKSELDGGVYMRRVQEAINSAQANQITGVPTIFYNGQRYDGPREHWAFATLVKIKELEAFQYAMPPEMTIDPLKSYVATLHTVKGAIVVQLHADKAPVNVNSFVFLARAGWYDNNDFFRVLPGFVAQTGDPTNTGYGWPGYHLADENLGKFDSAGVVGLANSGPNTNGSQFFITLAPVGELDGKYPVIGRVIEGLDVLLQLRPRDPQADPEAPAGDKILSVTIEER